jgi:hypothetical protein
MHFFLTASLARMFGITLKVVDRKFNQIISPFFKKIMFRTSKLVHF